jgi:hypothetical protein
MGTVLARSSAQQQRLGLDVLICLPALLAGVSGVVLCGAVLCLALICVCLRFLGICPSPWLFSQFGDPKELLFYNRIVVVMSCHSCVLVFGHLQKRALFFWKGPHTQSVARCFGLERGTYVHCHTVIGKQGCRFGWL